MEFLFDLILTGVFDAVIRPERPPWKPYSFHALVYVVTVIGIFASILIFLVGLMTLTLTVFDSGDVRQLPFALVQMCLPFFNIIVCFWLRKPVKNNRIVAGAFGLVVSANLAFWLIHMLHLSIETENILSIFASLYFFVCIFLFSRLTHLNRLSSDPLPVDEDEDRAKIVRITPKTQPPRRYADDPEFLELFDRVNEK